MALPAYKRSRTAFIFGSLAMLFLFYYLIASFLPYQSTRNVLYSATAPSSCPKYSTDRPFEPSNSTWRNLPLRHPVGKPSELPRTAPQKLNLIQHSFSRSPGLTRKQKARRDVVRDIFVQCWKSYKDKAWLKDELKPISGGFNDRYGGWAATLVDNLDTLWIMNLTDDFRDAVEAALTVDFTDPNRLTEDTISEFETNIRHLGGFLSAYEVTDCRDVRLLDKATELGDMLYAAFDTPTRMPTNTWNPRKALEGKNQLPARDDNILANVASLTMEFTRLSQLTGDMRYFSAVQTITDGLAAQQNKTKLPGMWPQRYDSQKFDFTAGTKFSLAAESDSAYEYLVKMFILLAGNDPAPQYKAMYTYAIDTATRYILFRPMTPDNSDVLLSGKLNPDFVPESEHLACFLGGMFALGGRVFANDSHVGMGRKLTEGCAWAYRATPAGIEPESFRTIKCDSPTHCPWNEGVWQAHASSAQTPKGFASVLDARYHLRPEALESAFYLYRITGEPHYQDLAWTMFESILKQTKAEFGYAKLTSVMDDPAPQLDQMESFWTAEALKYMYLLYSTPDTFSLDDYVFSTEAHPFRIPKA